MVVVKLLWKVVVRLIRGVLEEFMWILLLVNLLIDCSVMFVWFVVIISVLV